jgi:hypothetical protein
MAFRNKTIGACLALASAMGAEELRFEVRHHSPLKRMVRKTMRGHLLVDDSGVRFLHLTTKKKDKPLEWSWRYQDIQQLTVATRSLTLLSYADSKWKLGADRIYRFDQPKEGGFEKVYEYLRTRLDQRLVAALAPQDLRPEWEIPAKHRIGPAGSEGVLRFGPDWISYSAKEGEDSRTLRFTDIDNISSSGPFQLTITTFERSKANHSSYRDLNFQLKEPLDEKRFEKLWLSLNQRKYVNVLQQYRKDQ